MMRRLLFLFIFISSQFCYGQSSSSAVLCPKLDSLLCKYIKTSNNDNYSIHLTFMEYGGVDFLVFAEEFGYDFFGDTSFDTAVNFSVNAVNENFLFFFHDGLFLFGHSTPYYIRPSQRISRK